MLRTRNRRFYRSAQERPSLLDEEQLAWIETVLERIDILLGNVNERVEVEDGNLLPREIEENVRDLQHAVEHMKMLQDFFSERIHASITAEHETLKNPIVVEQISTVDGLRKREYDFLLDAGYSEKELLGLWYPIGDIGRTIKLTSVKRQVDLANVIHDRLFVEKVTIYKGTDGKWYLSEKEFEELM